jgi:GxxExxY protein
MTGIGGIRDVRTEYDALTHRIIEAVIKVHRILGPGFVEAVYQRALVLELRKQNIPVAAEAVFDIKYENQLVGQHRMDLIVGDRIIVEVKAVEGLVKAHYSQVRSYLKATGLPLALLVNFAREKADYRRIEPAHLPDPPLSPRSPQSSGFERTEETRGLGPVID